MTRFNPTTNKAQFESESYGQGEELNALQNSAEMFVDEVQETQGNPRMNRVRKFMQPGKSIFDTPTNLPGEDVSTSQYKAASGQPIYDADMVLRRMANVLQSKEIIALMNDGTAQSESERFQI
jgi:hypothetical protein|tara:strand:+ start:1050 stop:1418 length:369 start_codon:yes stop_codon:yes gene_type:complete